MDSGATDECGRRVRDQAGVNFINILLKAFTRSDLKSTKRLDCIFALLVSVCVKASSKMLVKLTKGLLRRVTPGGPHLLGAQRPDATAQCQGLYPESDRLA